MPAPIHPHTARRGPSGLGADWLEEATFAIVLIAGAVLIATILALMVLL